jgi:hypothetical protein
MVLFVVVQLSNDLPATMSLIRLLNARRDCSESPEDGIQVDSDVSNKTITLKAKHGHSAAT